MTLDDDDIIINFGALPPLPDGWHVIYCRHIEHYLGIGPNNEESAITCNHFDARRWCFQMAAKP